MLSIDNDDSDKQAMETTGTIIHQDTIDLDNIFAFLGEASEVTPSNPLIDEINLKMNNLVHDLNDEVS